MFSQPDPRPPQRLGANNYDAAAPVGLTTVVSSVANTTGMFIRTMLVTAASGSVAQIRVGGRNIFWALGPAANAYFDGFLARPGEAIEINVTGAPCSCAITWDVL